MATTLALAGGCSGTDDEFLELECQSGQCDLFDGLKDLREDIRRVDRGDVLAVAGELASDAINSALEVEDFSILKIRDPEIFALKEEAENDLTLRDLDDLVSGLATRFGETDLTYEVNRLRRDHLLQSNDDYFAEAAFRFGPRVAPGFKWDVDVAEIEDVYVKAGFEYEDTVEARVIAAIEKESEGYTDAPLRAIKLARKNAFGGNGFVLPKDTDDVLKMKPGELVALSDVGTIAFNFGAGVPIFAAEPGAIVYRVVFSAALNTTIKGERMDVQIIRLGGNEVAVDVGLSDVDSWHAKLAIRDGWGVNGVLGSRCDDSDSDSSCSDKLDVSVGGASVNLGKLADKALQKELNRRLSLINGELSGGQRDGRVSVARFRFTLTPGDTDGDVARAFTRAVKGDLRGAQLLANQGEPGVIAEFDLAHSGHSSNYYAGIDLFGMSWYRSAEWTETETTIQTPGGATALLTKSVHTASSGWFLNPTDHALLHTAMASLEWNAQNPTEPKAQSNLVVELLEGDKHMEMDKSLDHYDGLILALAGTEAMSAIEDKSNEIERFVRRNCIPSDAWDSCRVEMVTHPTVLGYRVEAMSALEAELDRASLDPKVREFVTFIANKKLDVQSAREFGATYTGPKTSVVVSFRIDDAGMEAIASNEDDLIYAIGNFLEVAEIRRADTPSEIASDREDLVNKSLASEEQALRQRFRQFADSYKPMVGAEQTVLQGLGAVGPKALEVRFSVDRENTEAIRDVVTQSMARRRVLLVSDFFADLTRLADIEHLGEHVASYALLRMVPSDHVELRLNYRAEMDDAGYDDVYREAGYGDFNYFVQAANADPISTGIFDIETFGEVPN